MDTQTNQIETVEKSYGKDKKATVARWKAEIELYEDEYKTYHDRCEKILNRFKDERGGAETANAKLPRFNVLWSNNNVIEPSVYSQRAKIEASRRFHDRDAIGRLSCEVIERAVSVGLDDDRYDYDGVMMRARQDFCLLARAVTWERYEPVINSGQVTDDKTARPDEEAGQDAPSELEAQEPEQRLVWEHTCTEHLHYEDFGHTAGARAWEEVSAVWRKAYMTRDELTKRFDGKASNGKTLGADVVLDYCPKSISKKTDKDSAKYSHFMKACIYEIWDRATGKVYWISKEYPNEPLDVKEDTLGLRGFFPCPKPAYGTLTNDSLVPIPDYIQIQDLCNELDLITARITLITEAIQARGAYEKSLGVEMAKFLNGGELGMVPLDMMKMANSMASGGFDINRLIVWAPNEMLVAVLNVLYDARDRTKQTIDEVSGNFDMMRGQTDPRETATAQNGKINYQSKRMQSKVEEFARFVRDIIRIKAEITCEKFQPQTIAAMVGFDPAKSVQDLSIPQIPAPMPPQMPPMPGQPPMPPPEPQMLPPEVVFQQALDLMRNDTLRAYRIDIETDSTIALDQAQQKEEATEFVSNIGQFFQNVMPIIQEIPSFAPVAKSLLMGAVRVYKWGRSMEEELERAMDEAIQAQQQPQEAPPDPAMAKVQQDGQLAQMDMQQKQQQAMQASQESQAKMQLEMEHLKVKQLELQQRAAEKAAEVQAKYDITAAELADKEKERAAQAKMQSQKMVVDLMSKDADRSVQRETAQLSASAKSENGVKPAPKKPRKAMARITTNEQGERVAVLEEITDGK